ncbi:MAG: tetratricopeptide repeat protein [Gemmatimonadaceae bacterium]|nr:tetratricopeptide repeat protein [Gemmatimonadaceae bacterium]
MQGSPRIDELRQKFHENPRRYFAPLANEYRKAGDPEQAIAICRAHLAQQPGHMSGHVVYGQALYDADRIDEARVVFEKALSLDPDNAIVLKQLGDIARRHGETAEARHWYGRALDADPHDAETAAYIAELTEPVTEETAPPPAEAKALDSIPEAPENADVEVPLPEPAAETDAEVAWRKTPPGEESPFVTRTMAELYARQGYRAAALDVYRQLALDHPDDKEILGRIEELSAEPASSPETEASGGSMTAPDEPAIETVEVSYAEASNDIVYAPSSEDLNIEPEPETPISGDTHFTEIELQGGDTWDTDSWGAGFTPDEPTAMEFEAPDTMAHETAPESPAEAETLASEAEAAAEAEPEAEPEADDSHLVAYSPPPPDDDDLPHFVPKGPTVREFFATLGAHRPPEGHPWRSFTARAAVPDVEPEASESGDQPAEYPLATDAFSELFPDSPVSEEDSRAAFALSGALGASTPEPAAATPAPAPQVQAPRDAATRTPPPAPPIPESSRESEEDIRRFREWLDGLAES